MMIVQVYLSPEVASPRLQSLLQHAGFPSRHLSDDLPSAPANLIVSRIDILSNQNLLSKAAGVFLILEHEKDVPENLPPGLLWDYSVGSNNINRLTNLIEMVRLKGELNEIKQQREAGLSRVQELNRIGIALSTEKDPVKLLNMILSKCREITCADAGSLYLVEGDEQAERGLRFKISQNDSMTLNYEEFVVPITHASIAGYVASTGRAISIPDAYEIPSTEPFTFNKQFDESTGYHTTSILAVPMKNHRNEITGVIQLINRKKDFTVRLSGDNWKEVVRPFLPIDEDLASSLASQAAVALENSMLIKSIRKLFEGFVTASVTAIESRDPTTSGHSFRVANLTVGLAVTVDRCDIPRFADLRFTEDQVKEMRYAALLHDFGKVGVRENVLVKAKKLYSHQVDLIRNRFELFKKAWEAEYYRSSLHALLTGGQQFYDSQSGELEKRLRQKIGTLEEYLHFVLQSNEPTVTPEGNFERLVRIAADSDVIPPGETAHLLDEDEVRLLSIRKGSLNDQERLEIQSHVSHTFAFLNKIPWTAELKGIPAIAYGHHEKLDGSGYPNRLRSTEIPVQTRIMTISDIFDALTAADRPYKPAVPIAKALDILQGEANDGTIDADLLRLFVDAKVYELSARQRR